VIDSVKHYVAESDCIHYLVVNLEALKYSRNPFSNKVKHLCVGKFRYDIEIISEIKKLFLNLVFYPLYFEDYWPKAISTASYNNSLVFYPRVRASK